MQVLRAARERLGQTSLLVRVLALVGLGLAIVLVGFALLSAQAIRDSTARTLQERLVTAQVMARHVDDHLHELAHLAALGAARLPTAGGESTEATREAWRGLRQDLGPSVQRIVALDGAGRVLWTSPYDATLLGLDLSGSPAVKESLGKAESVFDAANPLPVPASLLQPNLTPSLVVVTPMPSPPGGFALLLIDLNQSPTLDQLKYAALGQTGYAEVVGSDGRVLASTRADRQGVSGDHGGFVSTLIKQGTSSVGTCHDCHEGGAPSELTEDVVAFAPLPKVPLAVALRQDSSETFAFEDTLLRRSLLFGGLSFALAMAVAALIVVRLVRPVKTLTAACQGIAAGDLSAPVAPLGGGEMGVLASSFERMRLALKASREQIRQWGEDLEQQVAARTAELQTARDELQRSHDYLATIFDSLDDRVAVIDRNYRVVQANRALQRRQGEGGSMVGAPCYAVFHGTQEPCDLQHHSCPAKTVWRTGQPSRVTHIYNGEGSYTTYVDIVASPVLDSSGQVVSVLEVARDITESKRLEEQVIRTSEELSTLVSLSSAIACSMDLRAILGLALDQVIGLVNVQAGGVFVEGAEGGVEPVIVARNLAEEEISRTWLDGHRPNDRMEVRLKQCEGMDLLCVPIATSDKVLGEMFICCPGRHWLSDTGLQLLVSIGSQLAVAVENARLYQAVRREEAATSTFLRKYIAAQEDERKRIARELHDETAQSLTALAMAIETAVQAPTRAAGEVRALLAPARSLTERVSREIDRIIRDLRPSLLDDLGLLEALGWYADNRLKPLGIQVTFETIGSERRLPPELETSLFRVAQEAMSNIARHAEAENVSLTMEFGDDYVALDVEDDGCGFDVERTLARGKNGGDDSPFGLMGMRERVELLGGSLLVESRPGQGTSVTVRVPVDVN